ncbi:phosphoribosylglycinamide synthetase, partial [Micromonospora musae]|uniref:ATP-grasp domain-containing protein n=1 Tax=Micromonospora musae TaxID=1894970 RepID=UPI003497A7CD
MHIIHGTEWDPARKTVLLVGAGERIRREYTVRSIASGYNILLIDDQEISWQSPYVTAACTVSSLKGAELWDAADALLAEHAADGVLTYADYALEDAAELARSLGVRYTSADSVRATRDKHLQRQLLAKAGVRSARSVAADSLEEAHGAAGDIGYPVVFKPRNLGMSAGVVR